MIERKRPRPRRTPAQGWLETEVVPVGLSYEPLTLLDLNALGVAAEARTASVLPDERYLCLVR